MVAGREEIVQVTDGHQHNKDPDGGIHRYGAESSGCSPVQCCDDQEEREGEGDVDRESCRAGESECCEKCQQEALAC